MVWIFAGYYTVCRYQLALLRKHSMFNKLFKSRKSPNDSKRIEYSKSQLIEIIDGLGEYASIAFSNEEQSTKSEKAKKMHSLLELIGENHNEDKEAELKYLLAIGYRNYTAWFVRGENRKMFLDKVVFLLREADSIDPRQLDSRAELGRILIDEKVVRNLAEGAEILTSLKLANQLPSHLNSILSKANRQLGILDEEGTFDLCSFSDPSPAVFREERKRFRALIRQYKKEGKEIALEKTLDQFYKLAVLVTICYDDHDCNSGTIGWKYDEAVKLVKKHCNQIDYTYAQNGVIENNKFLSTNDWKVFTNFYGHATRSWRPNSKFT